MSTCCWRNRAESCGVQVTHDRLMEIAEENKLCIITIEDLIAYRRVTEKLVSQQAVANLPSKYGMFKVVAYKV